MALQDVIRPQLLRNLSQMDRVKLRVSWRQMVAVGTQPWPKYGSTRFDCMVDLTLAISCFYVEFYVDTLLGHICGWSKAFYTIAVWLRERSCLNEYNLPATKLGLK